MLLVVKKRTHILPSSEPRQQALIRSLRARPVGRLLAIYPIITGWSSTALSSRRENFHGCGNCRAVGGERRCRGRWHRTFSVSTILLPMLWALIHVSGAGCNALSCLPYAVFDVDLGECAQTGAQAPSSALRQSQRRLLSV